MLFGQFAYKLLIYELGNRKNQTIYGLPDVFQVANRCYKQPFIPFS